MKKDVNKRHFAQTIKYNYIVSKITGHIFVGILSNAKRIKLSEVPVEISQSPVKNNSARFLRHGVQ